MACASGHSGKSIGTVSSKLVNLGAVGSLIDIGGRSGKGDIILLTPAGNGTEVWEDDSWLSPVVVLPIVTPGRISLFILVLR